MQWLVSYDETSMQIGKSYVVSKLKDYPQFCSVAIAIRRSGFKVCIVAYDIWKVNFLLLYTFIAFIIVFHLFIFAHVSLFHLFISFDWVLYFLILQIVLLLRLVPLLPFSMLNYLLSVTPVPIGEYMLASWLGMMVSSISWSCYFKVFLPWLS